MSHRQSNTPTIDRARWVPEKAAWKKLPNNLGMRAAGRLAVGLNAMLGTRARGRLGIVMYHRLAPRVPGLPAPLHNVAPDRFRAQLEALLRRGFCFVPLSCALDAAEQGDELSSQSVVVTFDDGFGSVYKHGWPVLKELGIPATIFVNTAYLDSEVPFPFDAWGVAHAAKAPVDSYRPLTTAECLEMMESGLVEIGAHTHTHEDFRGRPDSFREDLSRSVEIVRERFDVANVTFAFPYGIRYAGFACDELPAAARAVGVRCGLTTTPELVELSDSPFCWGRFNVFSWDTGATLAAKLSGWYSWAPKARQSLAAKLKPRARRLASDGDCEEPCTKEGRL